MKKGNKLIAVFMGAYDHGDAFNFGSDHDHCELPQWAKYDELKYHTSWDWLMPAYSKFSKLILEGLKLDNEAELLWKWVQGSLLSGNISEMHTHFVNLIKWYNQNNQP